MWRIVLIDDHTGHIVVLPGGFELWTTAYIASGLKPCPEAHHFEVMTENRAAGVTHVGLLY